MPAIHPTYSCVEDPRKAVRARSVWLSSVVSGRLLAVALMASALLSGASRACETPVYRYAMYRWQPAPYEVYFLHNSDPTDAAKKIETRLEELAEGTDNRANIVHLPVNLGEDPELLSVPPDVKQAWLAREDKELPCYLISTPYGAELYSGELTESSVASLVESPARKTLAVQLESGKVGVFLFLKGDDQAANDAARSVLDEVVADVGAGEVSLYIPPAGGGDQAEASKPKYELGLIELDRGKEEEQWLVKSLLAVEPDLKDQQGPMVFLVYGRARTLLPYIGKGISRENLLREVEFISGACSCTVKEQNPGVDLLVRYDWEAAAAALAERVGSEEGNESSFGADSFFPELLIPSSNEVAVNDEADESTDASGLDTTEAEASSEEEDVAAAEPTLGNAIAAADQMQDAIAADVDDRAVASLPEASAEEAVQEVEKRELSVFGIVGGGLAIALVVLFGVTLAVLRPQ